MELYLKYVVLQFQHPYIIFGILILTLGFWRLASLVTYHKQLELIHLLKDKTYKKSFRFFRGLGRIITKLIQALILSVIILGFFGGLLQNQLNQTPTPLDGTTLNYNFVQHSLLAFGGLTYGASLILVFTFARLTRKENNYSFCFKAKENIKNIPTETEIFLDSRLDEENYLCVYFKDTGEKTFLPLPIDGVMENEFYRSERFDSHQTWFENIKTNLLKNRKITRHLLTLLLTSILTFLFMYIGAGLSAGLAVNQFSKIVTAAPPFYWLTCMLPTLFYLLVIIGMSLSHSKENKVFKHEETEVKKPRRRKTKTI